MRSSAIALALLPALAGGLATADPVREEEVVVGLFSDLPVPFEVESVQDGEPGRIFRLRSIEPIGRGGDGKIYLRARVTTSSLGGATAEEEIGRRLAAADPDTGLSYAWDYVAAGAETVVHLHAECTLAREGFEAVARALARELEGAGAPPASFWCRCGGGCRAGSPFPTGAAAGAQPRRLPPVRRLEPEDADDYDNRLDPSGSWTSPIGELSLMHHANRLAFSYFAVFGATAHICEGAGVAGLVGTDRYEHTDEQGTVAFTLTETGVRMEPVEGIASFCGAGWSGDRFATDRYAPPAACRVRAEHTHFHVVDSLDLERTPATAGRGSVVAAVPARHTGDEAWMLARLAGPLTTALGLLARGDLDCADAAPEAGGSPPP